MDLLEYPNSGLNDEIITCKGARCILALFGERGHEFNHVNMVTALHRIAKAKGGLQIRSSACLSQLVEAVVAPMVDGSAARAAETARAAVAERGPMHCGRVFPPPTREHQNMSNTAWALSKLAIVDTPCFHAIASAALPTITAFNAQDLANTLWAFAKLDFGDDTLRAAISSSAIRIRAELNL